MVGQSVSHYEILEKLGEGGAGVVYKARDTKLGRIVALKFLLPGNSGNRDLKQSLLEEAQAAAKLNHPNIATVYAIEEIEHNYFMAMEYINGRELKDIIATELLPLDRIVDISLQLCEGLGAAHDSSIIHRDLKPSNVIVTDRGFVKIMDFGIAIIRNATEKPRGKTTVGTISYMSPEQLNDEEVDFRTDIWALGVIVYQLLTGQLPFHHEFHAALTYSILNESPVPPTELRDNVPEDLERIILRCLRKEVDRRYSSVREISDDLKSVEYLLKGRSVSRQRESTKQQNRQKDVERKRATILFVNITGYSEADAAIGQEEIASLLSKSYEIIESAARHFNGTVNRITEYTFRLLFGLPEAIENSTAKALYSAMLIRDQFDLYKKTANLPDEIEIRMGIDTGIVLAGTMNPSGNSIYNVLGEPVDQAYALMDASAQGTILIGASTYREVAQEFRFGGIRKVSVKGKKQPIEYAELLSTGEPANVGDDRGRSFNKTVMVGREKELAKLDMHLVNVINGEGSIITIIGEPGIGKSRLIEEFKSRALIRNVVVFEGRAVSVGTNLSYHPIVDILKKWAKIDDKDTEKDIIGKLEQTIAEIYPEGLNEVLPFLSLILGIHLTGEYGDRVKDITGEALVKLTRKNIRDLIEKKAELTPVVFIIEDLHWADRSSLELIQSLLRMCLEHRVVFIATLRPGYMETGERFLDGIRDRYYSHHSEIILEPLSDTESSLVIGNYINIKHLPVKIRRLITERAHGNPFFIEEVLESFIDQGILVRENGRLKLSGSIEQVSIPETIQDMLAARVDRLPDDAKAVLKIASVIGKMFSLTILERTVKQNIQVHNQLEILKNLQLIHKDRSDAEGIYHFKHALLHEVVYDSIPFSKRKDEHLSIAGVIEEEYADRLPEFYGVLAYHYSFAEELSKSEEYLLKAGELTLKTAASHEALHYFREALKLYLKNAGDKADPEKVARIEMNIGIALQNKGHMVDAVVHFENALEHLGQKIYRSAFSQNVHFLRDVLGLLVMVYLPTRKKKKAPTERDVMIFSLRYRKTNALANYAPQSAFMDLFGAIRNYLKFTLSKKEKCEMYAIAASLFSFSGTSFRISNKFLSLAREQSHDDIRVRLIFKFIEKLNNTLSGAWKHEYRVDEELIEAALKKGEFYNAIIYLSFSLYIVCSSGDFTYARRLMDIQNSISEMFDFEYGRLYRKSFEINLLTKSNDFLAAIRAANECIAMADKLSLHSWKVGLYGQKAEAEIFLGHREAAYESLQNGRQYLAEAGRIAPMLRCYFIRSQFMYDVSVFEIELRKSSRGSKSDEILSLKKNAYKSGKAALKLSRAVAEMKPACLMLMGRLLWLDGSMNKAYKYWNESITTAETLGARYDLSQIYFEIGSRISEPQSPVREFNGITAQEFFDKAHELFELMNIPDSVPQTSHT